MYGQIWSCRSDGLQYHDQCMDQQLNSLVCDACYVPGGGGGCCVLFRLVQSRHEATTRQRRNGAIHGDINILYGKSTHGPQKPP